MFQGIPPAALLVEEGESTVSEIGGVHGRCPNGIETRTIYLLAVPRDGESASKHNAIPTLGQHPLKPCALV